jgi:hypothetical protein
MSTTFYVVMQKRGDGFIYADLHKCLPEMFLTIEEAEAALNADPELAPHRHVVELVAAKHAEWDELQDLLDTARFRYRRLLNLARMAAEVGEFGSGGSRVGESDRSNLRGEGRRLLELFGEK